MAPRLDHLAPWYAIEGLFATISYRLEPQGKASRFPVVMGRLYAGGIDSNWASAADAEFAQIEGELRSLPVDRVVWNLNDHRRGDDSALHVNRAAGNVYEYFITGDGRPLLTCLREAVRGCPPGSAVRLHSAEVRHRLRVAWVAMGLGAVWATAGYLFLPDWLIVPIGGSGDVGVVFWPVGVLLFLAGTYSAFEVWVLRFALWSRRHHWFAWCLGSSAVAVLLWRAVRW